jgi:xanthine dehydrogenase accessory factor
MYDIADQVTEWQAQGHAVAVARVVESRGISSRDRAAAVAGSPGQLLVGTVVGGAADAQLSQLLTATVAPAWVEVEIDDPSAQSAGLSCGGQLRLLATPAVDLPSELWSYLRQRQPVCLVTALIDGQPGPTELFTAATIGHAGQPIELLFRSGVSQTTVLADAVVTALWPRPRLIIVGSGAIAQALAAMADLLDWDAPAIVDIDAVVSAINALTAADAVVVLSHEAAVYGPALLAALDAAPGYLGALGSRRTQQARAAWLGEHGITDVSAIHGPAGLNIAADTPAEVALSIWAEIIGHRSGATSGSLRDHDGPIHPSDSTTPWPRAR